MELLVPHVQHYAWGSESAIPDIIGTEPDGRPWAEMWVGDHPRLPSTVASTGLPLDADLPFLLKILAANQPLSVQTHPSRDQAQSGFARENAAGIPIDAPHRTYRDANHKPELICALTSFDALVGFRQPADIIADYSHIEALAPLIERLGQGSPDAALRASLEWLLRLEPRAVADLVAAVAPDIELVARLHAAHPSDRGALVALLLHRIQLEPGEAVLLEAGNLHAYISGVGVELMANSDNVVRGGLTQKHIDVEEMLAVVSFEPFDPAIQRATGPVHRFASDGLGFELTRVEVSSAEDGVVAEPTGDELVLITSGHVVIRSADRTELSLSPGDAVFVDSRRYSLLGDGVAWRAAGGR